MSQPAPEAGREAASAARDLCLVTGATGFIGGHVAQRLVRDGYRVRCLVRATSDIEALERLGVELTVGDLTNAGSLRDAARGCRFVLHCGALVSDWATIDEIRRINVVGTRNALEAAAAASVERFVHLSSTDVYGYPGGQGDRRGSRPGLGSATGTRRPSAPPRLRYAGRAGTS